MSYLLMDCQIKGKLYEIQIKNYIINELNKDAYLWEHTPEDILIKYNIIGSHNQARLNRKENKENPLRDTGIDIIQVDDDSLSLVQCKNGYKKGVTLKDLSGFFAWVASTDYKGYVYYTNKLSINVTSLPPKKNIIYVKQPFIEPTEIINNIITPYQYQLDASNKIIKHFENNNRGILTLPCGCGKTYTSYLISKNYKQIIIISPLKQFAKQNLDRFIQYGYPDYGMLIDSDGERDIKTVKKFIKKNDSFLLSSTYKSIDVIYNCLKYMDNPLIIVDEFHNISKNNIIDEEDNFYKLLNSEHNILFMSATPRVYEMEDEDFEQENIFGDIVYKMSFNDAIQNKFITDYRIWLPSIHEDNKQLLDELSIYDIDSQLKSKCMFLFINLLKHGSRKCIVYCKDNDELDNMINNMGLLNAYYSIEFESQKINANTSSKHRTEILNKFESSDKIQLLFSIRILDECIDIPSCDSIYIVNPPKSKIRTIQRISRCIRKYNNKKLGNIFIWCDEYEDILNTLSGLKEYDCLFKDKILVAETNFYNSGLRNGVVKDNELIKKYILEVKEFIALSWDERLEQVKKYIDEHGKRPSCKDTDKKIQQIGRWHQYQLYNYKNKVYSMKNLNIRKKWELFIKQYKEYFISNEEEWDKTLNKVKQYIDEYKKRPSCSDKDNNIRSMGYWISDTISNYKKELYAMKDKNNRDKWDEFINNYQEYFYSNEEIWLINLNNVKKYMDEHMKRPNCQDKDKEIKRLGKWITEQSLNYKKEDRLMKNANIRKQWEEFITNYNKFFISNDELWELKFNEVKKYIDNNKKRPSFSDDNDDIKQLAAWINTQLHNYKKEHDIMKRLEIRNRWDLFIEEYQEYFLSNEELWMSNLNKVKEYINKNKKKPDRNDELYLSTWISRNQRIYIKKEQIMIDVNIRKEWEQFIEEYKEYFISNEELWMSNLIKTKKYIDENKKRPNSNDKDNNTKQLGHWITNQLKNYKNKEYNMKDLNIRKLWDEFTEEYKEYLLSNEEEWLSKLNDVKIYINKNKKRPNSEDKDKEIMQLGRWILCQVRNYKNEEQIMKDKHIRKIWEEFTNDYKEYFISNEELWISNLNKVKQYIDVNKKRPSCINKDTKCLGSWIIKQQSNYIKNERIMKNQIINKLWKEFTEQYKQYL